MKIASKKLIPNRDGFWKPIRYKQPERQLAWYWPALCALKTSSTKMLRHLFRIVPLSLRVQYLKQRGITLGTRYKDGRKIHLYMIGKFFVEVLYKNDLSGNSAEEAYIVPGLTLANLNNYLEREFRNKRRHT